MEDLDLERPMHFHRRSPARRFFEKVDATGACWEWTGFVDDGYGRFWFDSGMVYAHCWAWQHLVGPIPDGAELDHLCKNTRCVCPEHLEPVTHAENTRRSASGARQRMRTHCPQGHAYDDENTYVLAGRRHCRECIRTRAREYQRRKRAERSAA